jgi:protein arginine N-methyltransferase 1
LSAGRRPSGAGGKSLRERLLDLPLAIRTRAARSDRIQSLVYELRNRRTFADLFQHDRMLDDHVRTEGYWTAIEKHVGPGDVVLDLGTGTGVLAMFAAKRGARVHAVEHGPIIDAAIAVAHDNGLGDRIEFHRVNSQRLELGEKVDVILHEQIGDALFDEKVIASIADLRDRLLKPDGRIYPSRLDLYIEPVELAEGLRAPFAWLQRDLHGLDFRALEGYATMSHSYLYRRFRPFPLGHFLCRPEPVVSIDLATADPSDLPTEISYERPVEAAGTLDGYCVYFDARFDDEIWFSSSPVAPTTSWATPFLRVAARRVAPGESIAFSLTADDLSSPSTWQWS